LYVPCIPYKRSRFRPLFFSFRPCKHLHFLDKLSTCLSLHTHRSSSHHSESTKRINHRFAKSKINYAYAIRIVILSVVAVVGVAVIRVVAFIVASAVAIYETVTCLDILLEITNLLMINLEALGNICVRIYDAIGACCCFIFFCRCCAGG
jgi:hypothetical protein